MDKLKEIFIAEAAELVTALEQALLLFEQDLQNEQSVQEIFRVMHTFKGSASMFGFDHLSGLTHDLETIYDAIRAKQLAPSQQILDITLQAVDHLKNIIDDPTLSLKENAESHGKLLRSISNLALSSSQHTESLEQRNSDSAATFYVFIKPKPLIFKNGTNLLYLVDDIAAIGTCVVLPHLDEVPALTELEPEKCYTSFEVLVSCVASEQNLRDVFVFVEDACDVVIERLSQENILESRLITTLVAESAYDKTPYTFEIIKAMTLAARASEDAQSVRSTDRKETGTTIRVSSEKLDELMNLVSELVTSQARLSLLATQHNIPDLVSISENMDKITRRLRDNAFNICLVPIETLVTRFQRLVRDLSKDLGKEVVFIADGAETELDRSVIEKVTDPILHILRNCMDHGIESPEERTVAGKSPVGEIRMRAYHSGTSVFITISDNGRGIDVNRIKAKAIEKGILSPDETITNQEALKLIFAPGFSTASTVTDVSGRGVGMDIVKRNIEAIHGEVSIETRIKEGTDITIRIPLTLSIIDGMLVKIAASEYILPLFSVQKCFEVDTKSIGTSDAENIVLDGELVPVLNLRQAFREQPNDANKTQVVKLQHTQLSVGLTVDAVVGEYQAVMKPLGDMYAHQEEFSGATILGDGSVALVIDTEKLVKKLLQRNQN